MLVVARVAWLRTVTLSDYILGGRRLGPLPSALSAGASDMSGWLLMGLPGLAYTAGLEAGWLALGLLAGTWANWHLVARRLRRYSWLASDSVTLPEYFEHRFQDSSHTLRIITAFFILLFFLFYTTSGLVAGGKLFETVFGISYPLAVVTGTLAVVSYTFFGGFLAVSWTDVIQGLLMFAALMVVPALATAGLGGWGDTGAAIASVNPALLDPLTSADGSLLGWIPIVSSLAWGLGYFGQPHILARFKAVRSEDQVPAARRIAVTWSALSLLGAVLVGLVAVAWFDTPLDDAERAFMVLVEALFHPVIAGMLLAAILAAIMSTADSQLLVSSAALTEDFYKALFRRHASQTELVRVGRLAVVTIALIAGTLALDPESRVLELVAYAWAGFGAAFGPAVLLSLFWRGMTRQGALAGIVIGGVTVVVWSQLSGGLFELYELLPGFVFSFLAIVAVSRLGPAADTAVAEGFDRFIEGRQ